MELFRLKLASVTRMSLAGTAKSRSATFLTITTV
jgi:hypothetical protein